MISIELEISKASVFEEVSKTTAYSGAKMSGDEESYDRIATTAQNQDVLERFWREGVAIAAERLKNFIGFMVEESGTLDLKLSVSSGYDDNLTPSLQPSLESFLVLYIVGKWFKFTNKQEADGTLREADTMMDDVVKKLYYRVPPTRPDISNIIGK